MAVVRADLLTRALGASCLATTEWGGMCAGAAFGQIEFGRIECGLGARRGLARRGGFCATEFDLPLFLYFIRTFGRVGV